MSTHLAPSILTLTGPSCSGKSVLARALVATGRYREAISTTTRAPRAGEINGVHYHFLSDEAFQAIETSGRFIECIEFAGKRYGVTVDELELAHAEGKRAILVCDQHGVEMVNRFAHENGWRMVAAFLDVEPALAIERFYERYASETDRERTLPAYAKRLLKVITDERDWRDELDFDLDLCPSLRTSDTDRQIAAIEARMARACVPERKCRRATRVYSAEALEQTLARIETALARHEDKHAVVQELLGLGGLPSARARKAAPSEALSL